MFAVLIKVHARFHPSSSLLVVDFVVFLGGLGFSSENFSFSPHQFFPKFFSQPICISSHQILMNDTVTYI